MTVPREIVEYLRDGPRFEYAEVRSITKTNRMAADGWRCVHFAISPEGYVVYLMEREKT